MKFYEIFHDKEWLNELLVWIVASLVSGFILALSIKWPVISFEWTDFGNMFLLSLLIFFVFIGTQKTVAYFLNCKTRSKLISFRRFGFRPHDIFQFDFPAWLIWPLLLVFVTVGYVKWLVTTSFDIEPKLSHVRKRFSELTEGDIARVTIAGPLAVIALGIISRIIGFNSFALLCLWFAFIAFIPIGYGYKLLMTSRLLWFFAFVFTLAMLVLTQVTSTFVTIVLAVLFAAITLLSYYILYEK